MSRRPDNWVFLGDSLTEGIGSSRVTYVTELARRLRERGQGRAVHDIRLREVDPNTFNRFLPVNLAGFLEADARPSGPALWLWNLGSESRTLDTDLRWLPLLQNLAPERVIVYRGSLESIVRPASVRDGQWPVWVPQSWRGFVAMDPRCYFSTTWLRWVKQAGIDALKQRARLHLLSLRPGRPLLDADTVLAHYAALLKGLRTLQTSILVLGLLPPAPATFPGSAEHFSGLNTRLRILAEQEGAEFFDWAAVLETRLAQTDWRYRDGFHPNAAGARMLAEALNERLAGAPGA